VCALGGTGRASKQASKQLSISKLSKLAVVPTLTHVHILDNKNLIKRDEQRDMGPTEGDGYKYHTKAPQIASQGSPNNVFFLERRGGGWLLSLLWWTEFENNNNNNNKILIIIIMFVFFNLFFLHNQGKKKKKQKIKKLKKIKMPIVFCSLQWKFFHFDCTHFDGQVSDPNLVGQLAIRPVCKVR